MESKDERVDALMNFTVKSFRLDPEKWRAIIASDDNLVALNGFFTGLDHCCLFIYEDEEEEVKLEKNEGPTVEETIVEAVQEAFSETSAHDDHPHVAVPTSDKPPHLAVPTSDKPPHVAPPVFIHFSLFLPRHVKSKVVCGIKPDREALTKENAKNLMFVEMPGDDALSLTTALIEEMALPLIGNEENCTGWPEGMPKEVSRQMKLLKKQALIVKAQTQGHTCLPQPSLQRDTNTEKSLGLKLEDQTEDDIEDIALLSVCQSEVVQACEWTIIEWVELVGEFLKQDSSELLVQQTRALPEEEFNFWESRLQNLIFIETQLKSPKALQVARIVENAQSVYAATLEQIKSNVQSALKEAEDITHNLKPLQMLLKPMPTMDYHYLQDQVASVMNEVLLLWTRSKFYCKPCHIVILLQEICNLFIELSRYFLGQNQVLKGLVSHPEPVLMSVCLCITTLEKFKECFKDCRTELDKRGNYPRWDFPSLLIFVQFDQFIERLKKIRELYRVTLDMSQLDEAIFHGINGKKWTELVKEMYNHFLRHVTVVSESKCDATDFNDKEFPQLWSDFHSEVQDFERLLVTVFSQALETCTTSTSAGKIVLMFESVLKRPLILSKLHRQFNSVWNMILAEVTQTEHLVQTEIQAYKQNQTQSQVYSGFTSREISCLIWAHQLEERVLDSHHNQLLIEAVEPSGAQVVSERCQSLIKLLQDFQASVRTQLAERVENDWDFILQQNVIQLQQSAILEAHLEVPYGPKLEEVLRELRFVLQGKEVKLCPQGSALFSRTEELTETYQSMCTLQSCYNQVVSSIDPVEKPLIQTQLQDLNRALSVFQNQSWDAPGLQREVHTQRVKVMGYYQTITEARANTAAIKRIAEGWGKIQLLQRQQHGLLTGRATEASQSQLSQDAQELLRLTQENMSLYRAEEGSEAWGSYLDHIDDLVQSGLVQLLQTSLRFLSESMKSSGPPLLSVSLVLQPQGSRFVPSDLCAAGGILSVEQRLQSIISELFTVSDLVPRISTHRDKSYQPSLKLNPVLKALQQEVLSNSKTVCDTAENLRAELDQKYGRLWSNSRSEVMREFLTYGRRLGPEEQGVEEAPPTLKEFRREIQSLKGTWNTLSRIDDVAVLQGWLQVDLRPFRDSVMSLTDEWSHMFTDSLLQKATDSFQKAALQKEDQPETRFPLTETLLLLETSGVQLPPALSAHIHC